MEVIPGIACPYIMEYSIKGNIPCLFSAGKTLNNWLFYSYLEYDTQINERYGNLLWADRYCHKAGRKAIGYTQETGLICTKHAKNIEEYAKLSIILADFWDKFTTLRKYLACLHWSRGYIFEPSLGGEVLKEEFDARIQSLIVDVSYSV